MPKKIAFLGIGNMGSRMAINLAKANHSVLAWNRTRAKAEALIGDGVGLAKTAEEACRQADFVITMLADGPTVESVVFPHGLDAPSIISSSAIWVDMSSIPPPTARRHAAALAKKKADYLDAPVSGGTVGAAEASLAIMAGGEATAFARALPVLEGLGRATHIGPVGSGQLAKLCNQVIVATTIGAVAEALLLASAHGADPAAVRQALMGGFADSRVLREHGQRMIDRNFRPGGSVRNQLKDLRTALQAAHEVRLDLPISKLLSQSFGYCMEEGFEGHDHSALLLTLEGQNKPHRVGQAPDQVPA